VAAAGKGKRRLMGEINVVPYIDVMLVLLIIFMITAPLLTQGIKVDLPTPQPSRSMCGRTNRHWYCRSMHRVTCI